jgi:hypothetical protein
MPDPVLTWSIFAVVWFVMSVRWARSAGYKVGWKAGQIAAGVDPKKAEFPRPQLTVKVTATRRRRARR